MECESPEHYNPQEFIIPSPPLTLLSVAPSQHMQQHISKRECTGDSYLPVNASIISFQKQRSQLFSINPQTLQSSQPFGSLSKQRSLKTQNSGQKFAADNNDKLENPENFSCFPTQISMNQSFAVP